MAAIRYRSIDEITETLQNAKLRKRGCTLLIGAGCSVRAGIPTAGGFVDIIRDRYQLAYQRAAEKTYAKCMGELLPSERRDLIANYVDQAKLNWAHLSIALLIQEGYVDRVLTTNFDLLVVRACALFGKFPAVYDFATSQLLKKADIPDQAVFYLHGQRTGFVLMNTQEDLDRHATLLGPVFDDAGAGRVWMVVGYSGETDPVFDLLADIPRFDNGLFWVGYGDREPAAHVRDRLLTRDKEAFFTKGHDADSFFVTLARALGIFPPSIVTRPFTYLDEALKDILPFTDPGQTSEDDVMRNPRSWIQKAIAQFEAPAWSMIRGVRDKGMTDQDQSGLVTFAAQYLLMAGRYEEVLAYRSDYDRSSSEELGNVLSIAYVMRGNQLLDRAKAAAGEEAGRLFTAAQQQYEAALQVKRDRHEALHNWGNALLDLAKRTTGAEADRLFTEAEEKYEQALAIAPSLFTILISWGNLLLDRGKAASGTQADGFFQAAEGKYHEAVASKPDAYEAFSNWGNLLLERGKKALERGRGDEADRLFEAAEGKYRSALDIKPDVPDVLTQWGNVLLDRAKLRGGGQGSDELFEAAEHKYGAALRIRPDMHEALDNWGNALLDRGKTKAGPEAARLFGEAEEKYRAALDLSPGNPGVLRNWGNLLADWERIAAVEGVQDLARAKQRYEAARDRRAARAGRS